MKKIILVLLCLVLFGCEDPKQTKPVQVFVDPNVEYICNSGDTLNELNQCINKTYMAAAFRWKCHSGYHAVGNYCWKNGGVLNLSKCGANHVMVNGYCYINSLATMEYYCSVGKLVGTQCIVERTYTPTANYYCDPTYEMTEDNRCMRYE